MEADVNDTTWGALVFTDPAAERNAIMACHRLKTETLNATVVSGTASPSDDTAAPAASHSTRKALSSCTAVRPADNRCWYTSTWGRCWCYRIEKYRCGSSCLRNIGCCPRYCDRTVWKRLC